MGPRPATTSRRSTNPASTVRPSRRTGGRSGPGIAALEGRPADALPLYREALRAWRDLGLAWDEALCGLDMALLLDPADPEVRAAAEAAREILVRLEAAPFIARLDAALARSSDRAGHSAAPEMAPATPP